MSLSTLSRHEAFSRYPGLSAVCAGFQKGMRESEQPFEPGESVWLDGDEDAPTVLSAEQAERLNREDAELLDALCDPERDFTDRVVSGAGHLILELVGQDFADVASKIGAAVETLAASMPCKLLAVTPLVRAPILQQENDYPDAVKARDALIRLGFGPSSHAAIEGSPQEMAEAIGPLFWIARCNASAPIIALGMEGTDLAFSFCKYGNFHVDMSENTDRAALLEKAAEAGFVETKVCQARY